MDKVLVDRQFLSDLLDAYEGLREWICAVPVETGLPAMPGIDGDFLDEVHHKLIRAEKLQGYVWNEFGCDGFYIEAE